MKKLYPDVYEKMQREKALSDTEQDRTTAESCRPVKPREECRRKIGMEGR